MMGEVREEIVSVRKGLSDKAVFEKMSGRIHGLSEE